MFLSICETSSVLSVISLIKSLLEIVTTIIPIVLIVMITIDISKMVIDADDKNRQQVMKQITSRALATVAIFFIPVFVNIVMGALGKQGVSQMTCWTNATPDFIKASRAVEAANKAKEREDIEIAKGEARTSRELFAQELEKARKRREAESLSINTRIKPYFQTDYPNEPYNPYNRSMCGSMADCACGLTSVAVVATAFNGATGNDPIAVRNWICGNTGSCTSSGTAWAGMIQYLRKGGLKVTEVQYSNPASRIINSLKSGKELIIPLYSTRGGCETPFTTGGHYFVLTGVASNGNIEIVQVSSRKQTAITWPIGNITKCMSGAIYVSK